MLTRAVVPATRAEAPGFVRLEGIAGQATASSQWVKFLPASVAFGCISEHSWIPGCGHDLLPCAVVRSRGLLYARAFRVTASRAVGPVPTRGASATSCECRAPALLLLLPRKSPACRVSSAAPASTNRVRQRASSEPSYSSDGSQVTHTQSDSNVAKTRPRVGHVKARNLPARLAPVAALCPWRASGGRSRPQQSEGLQ